MMYCKLKQMSGHFQPNGLHIFSSFSSPNFYYTVLSGGHSFGQFPLRIRELIPEASVVAPVLAHINTLFSTRVCIKIICIDLSKYTSLGLFPNLPGLRPQP